jgi:hypothetical protein
VFKRIPAAGDMQAKNGILITGFRGIDALFDRCESGGIGAIPGEKQAIGSSLNGAFSVPSVNCGKFNDERGCAWLDFGPILTEEAH